MKHIKLAPIVKMGVWIDAELMNKCVPALDFRVVPYGDYEFSGDNKTETTTWFLLQFTTSIAAVSKA